MTGIVQLEGLSVSLGKREILRGLTCSLAGRSIGLLGPNGAGKSTLINTLLGFHKPARGSARVLGFDVRSELRSIRERVGYMPENDALVANQTGVSFTRMMGELSGLPPDAALERAHEVLFYVGLGEARYRKLGTYSLGMRQLAKLAQAIVHKPELLILDEPTNGLDPPARQRMLRLIHEMVHGHQIKVILCSHLLRDVEECCEEVLILKSGQIVHQANLEEERKANKRFLEMETYGDPDGFAAALDTLGCECAAGGEGRFRMVLADGIEVRDIYRIAEQRGVQLRRLSYRRDSLEDIFLRAMNNGALAASGKEAQNGHL
jgi:ABC-2 type transport system ATP-binding protein